jgi:hypothetical protein
MKALEKVRTRRYETVNGLTMEFRRHLNNEPVIARPPSSGYRLRKFVSRNKLVFGSAAAGTVALCLGVIVSTWQAVEATRSRREAQANAKKAAAEALKNQQAAKATALKASKRDQILAPQSIDYCYQLAPLLVEMADLPGYGRHSRDALAHIGRPDSPSLAAQVAVLSWLRPVEGDELSAAVKLAERAASAAYADRGLPGRQLAKGLADFRQNRFASAIEWMEKVQVACVRKDPPGWTHERERNRTAAAGVVQAIANHQLGRAAAAQTAQTRGAEIIATQFPQLSSGDIGREWPDWLVARILLREAKELVDGMAAAVKSPFK